MGTNGKKFDEAARYDGKSTKTIQEELKKVEASYERYKTNRTPIEADLNNFYSHYIAFLRLLIAERIGK